MVLLSATEQQQVAAAIAAIERHTDAELVTVLARRADNYSYIAVCYAAAIALLTPGVIGLVRMWRGAWDFAGPWEMLSMQWLVFIALALLLQWPPLLARLIPKPVKRWRAANLARRLFLEQNLHHTRGETGVLIFVSELEHYVEIIADRGINRHVEPQHWQRIVDEFIARIRNGETLQGFLHCVNSCGAILCEHVPATDQKNELPNHMIVLGY